MMLGRFTAIIDPRMIIAVSLPPSLCTVACASAATASSPLSRCELDVRVVVARGEGHDSFRTLPMRSWDKIHSEARTIAESTQGAVGQYSIRSDLLCTDSREPKLSEAVY